MPFASTPPNFFGQLGSQPQPLTNQGNPIGAMMNASQFKTPNLFDTIQAVRQNEMDRQIKQATIAEALMKINQAPLENQYKQAQIAKAMYDMDPNNPENRAKLATALLGQQKLPMEEIGAMARGGFQPTSNTMPDRSQLLQMSPQDRMNVLQNRDQNSPNGGYAIPGSITSSLTGQRFAPSNKNQIQIGEDADGNPIYQNAQQARFDQGNVNSGNKLWQTFAQKNMDSLASSRSTLGMAANANMRADRGIAILTTNKTLTPQDFNLAITDLSAIIENGVPSDNLMEATGYNNLSQKASQALQFLQSNVNNLNNPEVKAHLIQNFRDLKTVGNQTIQDALDKSEALNSGLISKHSKEWSDFRKTISSQQNRGLDNSSDKSSSGIDYNKLRGLKL